MIPTVRHVLLALLATAGLAGTAAGGALEGRAPARAFTPAEYDAHPQCWSMVQEANGHVVVGNTSGLLSFDGSRWELDRLPNASAVVAVARGADGRTYVGGTGVFGWVVRDTDDRLVFHSLVEDLVDADRPYGDVWTILPHGDEVFFATLDQIYRLDVDGHVHRIDALVDADLTTHVNALASWGGDLWLAVATRGLFRWKGDTFEHVLAAEDPTGNDPARHAFEPDALTWIQPFGDRLLIAESDRLWTFDGASVTAFTTECDAQFNGDWIYAGKALADGTVVVGTVESGVHRLDADGRALGHWDATNDLLGNAVNTFGVDDEGGLWICQESGVVRVDLAADVRLFPEIHGLINDAAAHADRSIVLTTEGLFERTVRDGGIAHYETVLGGDDVTGIEFGPHGAVVAGSGWIARWKDGAWSPRLRADYPTDLQRSRFHPDRLYAVSRQGIVVLSDAADALRLEATFALEHDGCTLAERGPDELWVGSREGRVTRLRLDSDGARVVATDEFGHEAGVPASYAYLRVFDERVVLASSDGMRLFRDGRFIQVPLDGLREGVFDQIEVVDGELWALVDGAIGRVRIEPATGRAWVWRERMASNRRTGRIHGFAVAGDHFWANQTGRTARWRVDVDDEPERSFAPHLRRVAVAGHPVWSQGAGHGPLDLSTDPRTVHFQFSPGTLRGSEAPLFRTQLEGVDTDWSHWNASPSRVFTSLEPGQYVMHVQARDAEGSVSRTVSVPVRVASTWARSPAGLAAHIAALLTAAVLIGLATARAWSARIRGRNEDLERVVVEHTRDLETMNAQLQASNADLVELNTTLRRIDTERLELLGMASHDLKNPLGSIVSTADALVEDPTLVTRHPELIEVIREASDHMLERVDAMIVRARAEIGVLDLAPAAIDAREIAQRVVDGNESKAALRRQSLETSCHTDDPSFVGDPERLRNVLDELVVLTSARAAEGARLHVEVSETDDGLLRFALHDRARESARRLATRPLPPDEGSPTLRRIVELHGGRAWWVESATGAVAHGIDIPRANADATIRTAPAAV